MIEHLTSKHKAALQRFISIIEIRRPLPQNKLIEIIRQLRPIVLHAVRAIFLFFVQEGDKLVNEVLQVSVAFFGDEAYDAY